MFLENFPKPKAHKKTKFKKKTKTFHVEKAKGTLSTSRKFNPMASTLTSTSPGFKVGRLLLSGTVPPAYAAVFEDFLGKWEGKTQCFSMAKLNFRTSVHQCYII